MNSHVLPLTSRRKMNMNPFHRSAVTLVSYSGGECEVFFVASFLFHRCHATSKESLYPQSAEAQ